MPRRRPLGYESLESRHMLSSGASLSHFVASRLDGSDAGPQTSVAPYVAPPLADAAPSLRSFLASSERLSTRWDWLAGTEWFVPTQNLLAYVTSSDLANPQPIGDQTVWNIETSSNGQITGTSETELTLFPVPTPTTLNGIVTSEGQVRIQFSFDNGNPPVIGIGQMRRQAGRWTIEMQFGSALDPLITHWAYMEQRESGQTPPDPSDFTPNGDQRTVEWEWLEGTHWAIRDTQLFGPSGSGVFEIEGFDGGYYWGSGTGGEPFNVLGSVTPEGNLVLLVSVNGADPVSRAGQVFGNAQAATMAFRSYNGDPGVGSAWTLNAQPFPSIRPFISSVASQLEALSP